MGRVLQTRRRTPPGCAVGDAGRKTSAAEVEPNRHRRGEPQEKADDQRAAYLGVSTCILGPVDMRLQSCCANNDVERWACTPVITSVGCVCLVGVLVWVQEQELETGDSCRPVKFQGGPS